MPFAYTINTPDKVVFTRLKSGCGQIIFISVGSIFAFIGLCMLVFSDNPGMPLAVMRYLFPAIGSLVVFIGIKFPQLQRKSTPDEIIFDNLRGRVQINQQASDIQTAFIYYDEIDDFRMKIKKESSSSSSTRSSSTYYSYHVYLIKKDGGQWELLRRNSESAAQEEIARLKSYVNLNVQPVRESVGILRSSKYQVKDYGHKAELVWKNPVGLAAVFLILFSMLFITIFYTIVSTVVEVENDFPIFFLFIGGFIGVVFVIVIGGNIIKLIKNSKTVYAVAVSSFSLDYFERDVAGRIRKDIRFPLADLYAISFSFDTESTLRKIFIYTHDQFRKKNAIETNPRFSIEYIKTLYNFYQEVVALDIQNLTAVEALAVENYLQEQLRQKGNARVA